MAWGQRTQFFCNNRRGECQHALGDRAFSLAEFRQFNGRCGGDVAGCGGALKEGDPLDLRPRRAALLLGTVAVLGGGSVAVQHWLFPPPLHGVAFGQTGTELDSRSDVAEIVVVRKDAATPAQSVAYATRDVTARAGADYEAASGVLHFEPGERQKHLSIRLVPDASHRKPARRFEVVLENVAGTPIHMVMVAPRTETLSKLARLEQQVRTVSNIAMDIGVLVFKLDETRTIIAAAQADGTDFGKRVLRDTLEVAEQHKGNLVRAREAYANALRDLASQDAPLVMTACDNVRGQLQQQGLAQQAAAAQLMLQHLHQFMQSRAMTEMDRWVRELRGVIPAPRAGVKTVRSRPDPNRASA